MLSQTARWSPGENGDDMSLPIPRKHRENVSRRGMAANEALIAKGNGARIVRECCYLSLPQGLNSTSHGQ
jgi:hypothetical protein